MLFAKLGVNFFSASEFLNPSMKNRLRLNRARPNFYKTNENHKVSFGIVDCSVYTRRIGLKDVDHKKILDMLGYTSVKFNYLETLVKSFMIPAKQNQFTQDHILSNAPVCWIAIAMITNSAFTTSDTEIHSGTRNSVSDKFE